MSKATIDAIPIHTNIITMGDGSYEVQVNGVPVAIVICGHQADWMCRQLNQAREARTKHEAMNILTQTLGYCDDRATQILEALKGTYKPAPSADSIPDDILEEFLGGRAN